MSGPVADGSALGGPEVHGPATVRGSPTPPDPGGVGRLADVPVAIALVAEAAWIAVFAGLLEAFVLHDPVTGIPELFVAAAAGTIAARTLPQRTGEAWSMVAVGLAAVAGVAGWLASGEVRSLLAAGGVDGIGAALAANPGGWLAALAFLRGLAHARRPVDASRVGTVLALAVPALATAALVGGMISEPARGRFLATAQLQVLVFLAASVLALALARLANVGRGAHVDWRRNPGWLALAGSLVLVTALVAAWASLTIGHPIATIASVVAVPLLAIGFVAGFDRRSFRILLICLAIAGALAALGRLIASRRVLPGADVVPPPASRGSEDPVMAAAPWILTLGIALAAGAVLVLARLWLRRTRTPGADDAEVRVIDRGDGAERPPRRPGRPRFRHRARPMDAVTAYRALLVELADRRPVAREPGETPAEHARRLRGTGHGGLALELLAADYGLVRFGGLTLSDAETRRAIGRAERLRRALLLVPVEVEAPVGAGVPGRAPRPAEAPVGRRGSRRGTGPSADLPDADEPGETGSILNRIRRGP